MDNASVYIKKLIALVLSAFVMYLVSSVVYPYIAIPFGFLVLSFLHFKITGEKPAYLFGMPESEKFLAQKGGFWLLFRWILMLFGFLYDLIVWTLNGIYVLFQIFIDILLLVKTVIFWIIHAVIWVLKLFVPPLVFIYKMTLRYLIFWPWWIYKLSYVNVKHGVNGNFYRVSFRGAFFSIFIFMVFYGASILTGAPVISVFGVVFAFLPVIWAFGEISSMRMENRWNTAFHEVKMRFGNGFEALRAVLFYLTVVLVGILIELGMNMLGWIPGAGLSLLGLTINVNTFVTLILVFIFVILVFASLMIPPHVVYEKSFTNNLSSTVRFLGTIGHKFLRYLFSLLPASFFTVILALIPALIVALAVYVTVNVKNIIIDSRVSSLNHTAMTLQGQERMDIEMKAARLVYYKDFPQNVFNGFTNIKELKQNRKDLEKNYEKGNQDLQKMESMLNHDIDSLNNEILKRSGMNDSLQAALVARLRTTVENKKADFSKWQTRRTNELARIQLEIKDARSKIIQLPVAFLLCTAWLAFFGGIIVAVMLAYLGNVFFSLYGLKEDGRPTYWNEVATDMKKKDHNQPLLGFTLLILLIIAAVLLFSAGIVSLPASIF